MNYTILINKFVAETKKNEYFWSMKNFRYILPLTAVITTASMMSCTGIPDNGFEISVSAADCNNLMVKLYREGRDGLEPVDSQKVEMHKARLCGEIHSPELMFIYMESADDYIPIFVEQGLMEVEVNLGKPARSAVSGSESNKIFTDFMQAYSVYDGKASGYNRMAMDASMNNDTLMLQDLESAHDAIMEERVDFQRSFVQRYIDRPIACYILSAHLMYELDRQSLNDLLDSIPESNRDNIYYRKAERHLSMISQPFYADSLEYGRLSQILRDTALNTIQSKVTRAALLLAGKPYVGGTLDNGACEQMVVNLCKFDCVTFQETCLALAKDAMDPEPGFRNFVSHIENMRYRDGRNTGYASRLHYSTDWILDNTRRGNAQDLTPDLGGVRMTGAINFMSTHADKYKALEEEPSLVDSMKIREKYLTANHVTYIPKARIDQHANNIESGSLIFIATAIPGLGYSHVGIAYNDGGRLRMIHASSTEKKVTTTTSTLQEYLMGQSKALGITVLKP